MQNLTRSSVRAGFTLVELLVVIGIITVLIALLLPALGAARRAATNVKCLATLRSMSQAAQMHAGEHKGHLPLAGVIGPSELGIFAKPVPLRDAARQKYMYYSYGRNDHRPVPLPAALAHYMGVKYHGSVPNDLVPIQNFILSDAVMSRVSCPGQAPDTIAQHVTVRDANWSAFAYARMGYVFNDALLSRYAYPWGEGPAGQLSRVRQPDQVFLFADGVARAGPGVIRTFKTSHPGYGISMIYGPEDTMLTFAAVSFYQSRGLDSFDPPRHRNRVNAVFVDGHCETLMLPRPDRPVDHENPGDLQQVWVSKGLMF